MQEYKVKIIEIKRVTHDVRSYKFEKPAGFKFTPGQAADVSINKPGFVDLKRPFTFTCLNDWDHLEFTIKSYNDYNGVTKEIGKLVVGDELIISEPWGTISYKGEGTFIAGGAGVTPFIAILRDLEKNKQIGNNKLLFANKTESDIILKDEFEKMLGKNFINILSAEKSSKYASGIITKDFLKRNVDDLSKKFYVCGPDPMIAAMEKILIDLGVNKTLIVKEEF